MLCGVAGCMKQSFEDYGKVYRIGGDEFVTILFTDEEQFGIIKQNFDLLVWISGSVTQCHICVAPAVLSGVMNGSGSLSVKLRSSQTSGCMRRKRSIMRDGRAISRTGCISDK